MTESLKSKLEVLPQEIFQHICGFLTLADHARLARGSRQLYWISQEVLYRSIKLESYTSLSKLAKVLKEDPYSRTRTGVPLPTKIFRKDIKQVEVTLQGGRQPGRSVSFESTNLDDLSTMIGYITSQCPEVEITLRLVNWPCVQNTTTDPCPRIVRIIAYFGVLDAELVTDDGYVFSSCSNIGDSGHLWDINFKGIEFFWTYFLGGNVFPDLRSLELDHL